VQCATTIAARLYQGLDSSSHSACYDIILYLDFERMDANDQRQKRRNIVLSSLEVAIEASNIAKELCSITPAKSVFSSFSVILTMIKVGLFLRRLRWSVGG
jgi:hypothetical protein